MPVVRLIVTPVACRSPASSCASVDLRGPSGSTGQPPITHDGFDDGDLRFDRVADSCELALGHGHYMVAKPFDVLFELHFGADPRVHDPRTDGPTREKPSRVAHFCGVVAAMSVPASPQTELAPAGLTWAEYIARWVAECGGWLPLADQLIHRAGDAVEIPSDPQTVERGLRRLARRDHKLGGQYGRWMLRFFGVTQPVEQWLRWLGTYHTRFSDLPSSLRLEQLALWNRPPIAESPLVCWIHLGIAHVHHTRLEHDACDQWLTRAELHAHAAGAAAQIEVALLRVESESNAKRHETACTRLNQAEQRLQATQLPELDALSYRARLGHARAVLLTRPAGDGVPDFLRARAHYLAIPDSTIPFVAFSKAFGLAYCAWKLDDPEAAARFAQRAADEAGDGGLVRMRVTALNMLSRVLGEDAAAAFNARAGRMAAALEDEDLLRRVAQCAPAVR